MKQSLGTAAILFTLLLMQPLSKAQTYDASTGNAFLTNCATLENENTPDREGPTRFQVAYCMGYFSGLLEGLDLQVLLPKKLYCIPEDPQTHTYKPNHDQLLRVFFKYLRDHPERTHESTGALLVLALKQAFPCPG